MKNVTFTKSEYVLLKIADDVINLCPPTNEVLSKVPKFAQTINLLREKRNFITEQSAKMHQAKSSKETLVVNASQEKTNLIGFITDALGMLEEYADQEKAGQLKKQVPNLRVSNLNKHGCRPETTCPSPALRHRAACLRWALRACGTRVPRSVRRWRRRLHDRIP